MYNYGSRGIDITKRGGRRRMGRFLVMECIEGVPVCGDIMTGG